MGMKRDQKGFTIVELLIAVAILSIVVAAVCGFILVGSRSYAAGNSDISVQQEAQLALNQMSDVMIDTTRSVNYAGYDASGSPAYALKDAEFAFTPEDKSLVMYNGVLVKNPSGGPDIIEDGNGNKNYHFYWDKSEETLFYAEVDATTGLAPIFGDPGYEWVTLASHVTNFSVDLSQVQEKRVVMLALTFVDGVKEYVTSNNVTIRNKVGVNDAELEPLNRKKTISVTARDSGVIIEPGETYHFSTPRVTGENVTDRSVEWSVEESHSPTGGTQFTDKANGILKIATDEPAGDVMLKITTKAVGDDGQPATCPVTVHIKRVRAVGLSATSDGTETDASGNTVYLVSPGSSYTITADVTGYKLEEVCSVCGDDTTIDRQVVYEGNPQGRGEVWRIYDPTSAGGSYTVSYAHLKDQAPNSVTLTIDKGAPTSDETVTHGFVVQALSLLSVCDNAYGRSYDWVPGAISFKVVQGNKNIDLNGELLWGASADLTASFDNPKFHYYMLFARIREYGTTGNDKIMVFLSEGKTTRVTPDMFGVETINKPWQLSLQALQPKAELPAGVGWAALSSGQTGYLVDHPEVKAMIEDYLAPGHCDASGTYIGTAYEHTGKLETMIYPPEILYQYNGQVNLEGELKLQTVTTLAGPFTTNFGVDKVKNTRDMSLGGFAEQNVKFSVYRETEGGLEKLYGYNGETKKYEGESEPYDKALKLSEISNVKNMYIRLDTNKKDKFSQVAGKYRLIPTIIYTQGSSADHYSGSGIYYTNYTPTYEQEQYYEDKRSTVYYEVIDGGNLELWSYAYNQFTLGEIYFPAPSEPDFMQYFNKEESNWQNAKRGGYFAKTIKGRTDTTDYQPSSTQMQCQYVNGRYELKLFYTYHDDTWNRDMEASAGLFCYDEGKKRWIQRDKGTFDTLLKNMGQTQVPGNAIKLDNSTADVDFTDVNEASRKYEGKMYIPLPSEKAFSSTDWGCLGFTLKQEGTQTASNMSFKYRPNNLSDTSDVSFSKVECIYEAAKDTYTIKLYQYQHWPGQKDIHVATFICGSAGNRWMQMANEP